MSRQIDWQLQNRQPIISVSIIVPEPHADLTECNVDALVDTGSTTSGITAAVANTLGLMGIGKRPLVSARHDDQVERFIFRIGLRDGQRSDVPSIPFIFDAVIGFELRQGFRFQALLGMDMLRHCDLQFNRDGRCSLTFD